jgi:hypothetical protein
VDAKSISGSVTWRAGTGKYAGITGIHKFVCDDAFRAAGEEIFFYHCTNNGSYKLPWFGSRAASCGARVYASHEYGDVLHRVNLWRLLNPRMPSRVNFPDRLGGQL